MMTAVQTARPFQAPRALRKVVVVSKSPYRNVINSVLDAVDYDVVFVESIAGAYSQIKRVSPDLVVVCVSMDDLDSLQVLSMLKLDAETSRIPVVTHMVASFADPTREADDDDEEDMTRQRIAIQMN